MFDNLRLLWNLWGNWTTAERAAAKEPKVKSIFASKTFWFALVAGVIGTLQSAGVFTAIPAPYGPAVLSLVTIALRYVTTQPVSVLPPS